QIECIDALTPDFSPLRDVTAFLALRRFFRAWRPDVVHTHTYKSGALARRAAADVGVPCVVHTMHGLRFASERGLRRLLTIHVERRAARRTHAIVDVSHAVARDAIAHRIGTASQHSVIYCGRDVSGEERRTRDDAFVIATIARLAPGKGHRDLL